MLRHVVLDIDECLVHTFTDDLDWELYERLKASPKTKNRVDKVCFNGANLWFVRRPGLDDFLDFCFAHFETVTVWSAGAPDYVRAIVEKIFKTHKPHLVMTRDHILRDSITDDIYAYSKPLMFYFEKMPQATRETTLLIDDRRENSKYDPENIIHIPEYDVSQDLHEIKQDEGTLLALKEWIESLDRDVDLRCFDHEQAFL